MSTKEATIADDGMPGTLGVSDGFGHVRKALDGLAFAAYGAGAAGETPPGEGWFSINCHWWDWPNGIGIPVVGDPSGEIDVWATGADFADAVANAIRYVEALGHSVDRVMPNERMTDIETKRMTDMETPPCEAMGRYDDDPMPYEHRDVTDGDQGPRPLLCAWTVRNACPRGYNGCGFDARAQACVAAECQKTHNAKVS